MNTAREERFNFLRITSVLGSSKSEIVQLDFHFLEVERLTKLKTSRMKELVTKRTSRLQFLQHGSFAQQFQLFCASVVEDSFEYLDARIERIAGADIPTPYAANFERMAFPQISSVQNGTLMKNLGRPAKYHFSIQLKSILVQDLVAVKRFKKIESIETGNQAMKNILFFVPGIAQKSQNRVSKNINLRVEPILQPTKILTTNHPLKASGYT